MEELRKIIKEEFENVLKKTFSSEEISDAITNKHFIHTKGGIVYSPVKLGEGSVVGINNDCQHVDIPLEEITLVQSAQERFKRG